MRNWMSYMADGTALGDMVIPGTHDTMATVDSQPQYTTTSTCQDGELVDQLCAGVRCIDIKIRFYNGILELHHGTDYLHDDFRSPLYVCRRFLKENPSETIIMMVGNHERGRDDLPDPTTFEELFIDYLWGEQKQWSMSSEDDRRPPGPTSAPDVGADLAWFWTSDDPTVTLGQVRGKILLWRRYPRPNPLPTQLYRDKSVEGFAVEWPDPPTGPLPVPGFPAYEVHVQDDYNKPEVADKIAEIKTLMGDTRPSTFLINFTSAAGSPGGWTPRYYASKIHPLFQTALTDWRTAGNPLRGVFPMDFPSPELIELLVAWNFPGGNLPAGLVNASSDLTRGWSKAADSWEHDATQCNTVYVAPAAIGTIEMIGSPSYGITNLRFKERDGQIIFPQKSYTNSSAGDGWLTPDFGDSAPTPYAVVGMTDLFYWGSSDRGIVELDAFIPGRGLVSVSSGAPTRDGGIQPPKGYVPSQPVISWLQTFRKGGYGITDIRVNNR
jgi:hypothetical protein